MDDGDGDRSKRIPATLFVNSYLTRGKDANHRGPVGRTGFLAFTRVQTSLRYAVKYVSSITKADLINSIRS
jgi:hypothetical protein